VYVGPVQLTRKRVIAAAMELIERAGVEAVGMPRLATELGCSVTSLYDQVPSKSALLDGIAEVVLSGIDITYGPGSWQEQVRAQARALRQVCREHPRCSMAVIGRPPASASIVRPAERALATLRAAGFGGQDAVRIMRAVAAYIMGSLLREAGAAPGLGDLDDAESRRPRLRAAEFPQVRSLTAELNDDDPDAEFEFGLDLLLHSLAARCPAR
jgi:AcrR family transcriptional regulator